ncbi:unnamed protein product [Camellia sinensis]
MHVHSVLRCMALQRNIAIGFVDTEAKAQGGERVGPPVRAAKVSIPCDNEAMKEFVAKGGMISTAIGPKGVIELDKDSYNYQKELQDKKFEQEALKLRIRMRN